jgi:hypothetical protein
MFILFIDPSLLNSLQTVINPLQIAILTKGQCQDFLTFKEGFWADSRRVPGSDLEIEQICFCIYIIHSLFVKHFIQVQSKYSKC